MLVPERRMILISIQSDTNLELAICIESDTREPVPERSNIRTCLDWGFGGGRCFVAAWRLSDDVMGPERGQKDPEDPFEVSF